ncbi:MAG: hypothetical protein WC599_12725 [Bacteroidales bacterium]
MPQQWDSQGPIVCLSIIGSVNVGMPGYGSAEGAVVKLKTFPYTSPASFLAWART